MSTVQGGPAFPSKRRVMRAGYSTNEFEPVDGMSLRDYFAAKAMPAVMCANGSWHDNGFKPTDGKSIMENHALFAYQIADAMLAARKGGAS